jgi:hypothetical protein
MDRETRRAAQAAYKETKTRQGAFAVRCSATGAAWVGASRHLDTHQNGLFFALRQGSSLHRTLQAAFKEHGEAAFAFEALEALPDDLSPLMRPDALKALAARWREALRAEKL